MSKLWKIFPQSAFPNGDHFSEALVDFAMQTELEQAKN